MLQDQKIYCLQARPLIVQPGNFTGWGSEGVNLFLASNMSSSERSYVGSLFTSEVQRKFG